MNSDAQLDAHLRRLAEAGREHVIMFLDPEGTIVWCNAAGEEVFGAAAGTLVGRHLSSLFTDEDRSRDLPEHELSVARSYGASENDRWLARVDGSQFWASGATTCLRDEGGQVVGFGKILRNRTDLKAQLDTLRNKVGELSEREEQRSAFLSTLSHELRNPLGPLSNAAELLRRMPADSQQRPFFLDIIDRQIAMISRLVDDLLDVARFGAGKMELTLRSIVLQDVLRQAVEATASRAEARSQELKLLTPAVSIAIRGDEHRLVQVFTNLIGNAVKYTPENGRIWITATVEEDEAVARVEDDGVGIATDMLPHIFDLFTQVDSTRGRSEGGLGIGLSVVKSLVMLHGGTVQVRSDGIGRGAEFIVRLPMDTEEERSAG